MQFYEAVQPGADPDSSFYMAFILKLLNFSCKVQRHNKRAITY